MDKPYFHAKRIDGNIEKQGMSSCFFGHKIPRGADSKPDGVFVEWIWNGHTLKVENDRYGFYPLYYYCLNNEICISPSILRLLKQGAPRGIDYTALSVFLRIGWFIGEDTPFKYIKALPPNAKFQWQDGKLEVSGRYEYGKRQKNLSYDQAIDEYIYLFRESIRKRLPKNGNFILPLSGGRDSRHILFELSKQGYKPDLCITSHLSPPQTEEDVRIAQLLTQRLNIKHFIIDQRNPYFETTTRRNLETNFCSDEHIEAPVIADYLAGKTDIIYDGLAGGILSNGFGLQADRVSLYASRRCEELAHKFLKGFINNCLGEDVLKGLLRDKYYMLMGRETAVQHLVSELKRHADAPNPLQQFLFWNRTRREISLSPYGISSDISTVYSPYIDHDLYDFLSSLDANYFLNRSFHTTAIERAFPEYADIPFEDKNARQQDARILRKRFVKDFLGYLINSHKFSGKLLRNQYLIPRLIKYLIKGDNWWICPHLIYYLIHLGEYGNFYNTN